jgi:hypothetical protein
MTSTLSRIHYFGFRWSYHELIFELTSNEFHTLLVRGQRVGVVAGGSVHVAEAEKIVLHLNCLLKYFIF